MSTASRIAADPGCSDLERKLRVLFEKGAGRQGRRREALKRFELRPEAYMPAVCRLANHELLDVSDGAVWLLEEYFSSSRDLKLQLLALRSFPARCAPLAELAVRLTQNLVESPDSAQHLSEREKAEFLNNLSERLAEAGRLDDALARAHQAVQRFKSLPTGERGVGLVQAMMTLAKRHAGVGQREPALLAASDAAEMAGQLSPDSEPSKEIIVGMALTCLSNRLLTAGFREEAAEAGAVAMARLERFRANGAELKGHLGMAALARANAMIHLGQHRDAIPIAQLAYDELNEPAASEPGEFWECLLAAANALSIALAETGHVKDAHRIVSARLRGFDELADRYPLSYGAEYVAYLVAHSASLGDAGNRTLALEYAIQAVARVRRMRAKARTPATDQLGVRALNNLFNRYYEMGDFEEALRIAKQAFRWTREAARADNQFAEDRIRCLRNLAEALRVAGRASKGPSGAFRIAQQAVTEALAKKEDSNPNFQLLIGHCLSTLALCCLDSSDIKGALQSGQESAEVRRRLFHRDPVSFRRELAFALRLLADCHLRAGNPLHCLKIIAESLRHYGLCAVETQEDVRQMEAEAFRIRAEALMRLDRPLTAHHSVRRALDLLIDLYTDSPEGAATPLFGLIPRYLEIRALLGRDIEPDVIAVVEAHKLRLRRQSSLATSKTEVRSED